MSRIGEYQITFLTPKPEIEKNIFRGEGIDIIKAKDFSVDLGENNDEVIKAVKSQLAQNPINKRLVLIHSSERETFRLCSDLRNALQEQFPNTFFFTYSIHGRGLAHHYGFVFDGGSYPDKELLFQSFQVYNEIENDTALNDFRIEFLDHFDLNKPVNNSHYSTYYPAHSKLPDNIDDRRELENKFYNEVFNKWNHSLCFKNETLCDYFYPLKEYKNFYYTENESKNSSYDMRRYFYDSSIWFRYMYGVDGRLQTGKIKDYRSKYKDYLNLKTSKITKLFHVRMFENSFLIGGNNSHGQYIIPFKFHSETLMENGAENELNKINAYLKGAGLKSWSWNLKLLDDYSDTALKGDASEMKFTDGQYAGKIMSKHNIIRHTLDLDGNGALKLDDSEIQLNLTIEEKFPDPASNKIWYADYSEDILLIDYLFTQNTPDGKHRFGDEVVKYFVKGDGNSKPPKCNSPLGKNWIFPVSAFNFVFVDSLSSQGIDYYGSNMILSQGGDPITTPNLFRYRFFKFLRLQMEEYGVNAGDQMEAHLKKMKDYIVDEIFKNIRTKGKEKIEEEKKEYIKEEFPEVVELVAKYRLFVKKIDQNSLIFGNTTFGSDIYIPEAVQSFIYKVAYGGKEEHNVLQQMLENFSDINLRDYLFTIWKGNA
ncbi:MAG: hypothetical protein AAF502_09300 [Bacteroidota bacterium]